MQCYRCKTEGLVLAPLWPYEKQTYPAIGIVMRICPNCGLEQNHYGDDDTASPIVCADLAVTKTVLSPGSEIAKRPP